MSSLKSKLDQALKLVLIFALVYILAVASYLNHIPPAPFIAQGVKQLYAQLLRWFPKDVYQTDLWRFADHEKRGVTRHDGTKAKAGYTLYSAGNETSVLLVDMEGELLHKWQKNFHDVWDESAAIKQPIDEKYIVVRDTHLYANGDLLILYSAWGDMPWGYGIVKLDKDSNIIWKRLEHYHHDLHVDSDGRIYTLEHEIQQQQPEGLTHFPEPFYLDDFVVVLSPDGEVEERISILDAFRTDGFANIHSPAVGLTGQNVQFNVEFEILHANAVRPISEDVASKLPFASPGDLLLSLRNLDALAVLNRKSEKLTWFNRGPWVAQHDPDFDEAGNIILFDKRRRSYH